MWKLSLFLLFITGGVVCVRIKEMVVPPILRNGTEEFVILDCDYEIEESEKKGLMVKWFFKELRLPVYQWIPNQSPQDLGILRGRVSLDYKAHQDKHKMYRALKITRPTVELSGDWICRVSTFEGDATRAASMIIFAPEKQMDMKVVESRSRGARGLVNISCWAKGAFPQPKLTIYQGPHREQKLEDLVFSSRYNQGAFDVSAYKVIEANNSFVFDCELQIPNTHYSARKSTLYEPGSLALKHGGMGSGSPPSGRSLFLSSQTTPPYFPPTLFFFFFLALFST